ncbi:hypothetical protein CVIRNUC_005524 [Coccomyxa viridis]|uniref:Uncharacterized protein n=1 Tax=Coccomyxa viridis TaxID=1274662 RepID=A0AAV1I8F6_9CHLO|nr:hypothetical protein CVIRNUC_005524 [Coccomyxa viridis]
MGDTVAETMSQSAKRSKIDKGSQIRDEGVPGDIETVAKNELVAVQGINEEADDEADAEDGKILEEQSAAMQELEAFQVKIRDVKDAAMEKILKVEQEAHAECIPIYKERMDAIAKIPSFWKFVLLQHGVLRDLIMEDDEEVLDYLEQVVVEENVDIKSGYKVQLHFAQNPWFSNGVLEKAVRYSEEGSAELTAVPPQWYRGKDLTVDQKSPEASEEGVKQSQPKESFFQWFMQTGERRDDEFNSDEIADIIREQIWPNPLPLYYGEVEFPNAPLDGADAALDADLPAEGDGEAAFMNEPLYDEHGNIVGEPVYDDDGNVVDYIQEGLYDDEENPPDEEEGLPEEYADLEGDLEEVEPEPGAEDWEGAEQEAPAGEGDEDEQHAEVAAPASDAKEAAVAL